MDVVVDMEVWRKSFGEGNGVRIAEMRKSSSLIVDRLFLTPYATGIPRSPARIWYEEEV